MVVNDIEISQNMKKKSLVEHGENYSKIQKVKNQI